MTLPPDSLYRRADLFDGWTAADPHSYASTFDARTYLAAVRAGLRAPEHDHTAHDRATHDTAVSRLLHEQLVLSGRRPVDHGRSRPRPDLACVHRRRRDRRRVSRAGLTVLTGGGPGAMEAAHLGARLLDPDRIIEGLLEVGRDVEALEFPDEAARILGHTGRDFDLDALAVLHQWQQPAFALAQDTDSVSNETIGIPTWLYGHEPPTPLATSHAKYFENSLREDGLLALATDGVVFLPGRAGTIQEIFQDAAQNAYRTVEGMFSPMVFYDLDGYWTERYPVRAVLEALFEPDDLHRVLWSTDGEEIVDFIDAIEPLSLV